MRVDARNVGRFYLPTRSARDGHQPGRSNRRGRFLVQDSHYGTTGDERGADRISARAVYQFTIFGAACLLWKTRIFDVNNHERADFYRICPPLPRSAIGFRAESSDNTTASGSGCQSAEFQIPEARGPDESVRAAHSRPGRH